MAALSTVSSASLSRSRWTTSGLARLTNDSLASIFSILSICAFSVVKLFAQPLAFGVQVDQARQRQVHRHIAGHHRRRWSRRVAAVQQRHASTLHSRENKSRCVRSAGERAAVGHAPGCGGPVDIVFGADVANLHDQVHQHLHRRFRLPVDSAASLPASPPTISGASLAGQVAPRFPRSRTACTGAAAADTCSST